MTWKDILKMTFDEAQTKATQIMMDKYNPEGRAGVSMDFATIPKYQEEYRKLVQSLYKAKEEEKKPKKKKKEKKRAKKANLV